MHPTTQLLNDYRSKVSFDQKEMTRLLYGPGNLYSNLQKANKVFPDNENFADLTNKSRKQVLLDQPAILGTAKQNFNLLDINEWDALLIHKQHTVFASISYGMAVQAIKYLGSDEQNNLWIPKFQTQEIISAYAQTEIGHGSDIQSLETTATFDNDGFIINSPTVSSTKFWPGDLGLIANHAIVYAQLIINGKSKGVYPFFVQIRDIETNKPFKGVTVGDIGPKLGYVSKDNGYLQFNNVKVPKISLLNRYIQLDAEGNFKKIGNDKISYASMMLIRKILISVYPRVAAKALTIAIRYSIVRQQFRNDNGVENSVLEYQTQQEKLIPRLAQLYALIFTGLKTQQIVDENFEYVQKGDFSKLQQTHVILASGKSWSSYWVLETAEWCRLSCGGHGFAHYSGLPAITFETAPNVTLEGENQVLMLQVAKYLLKLLTQTSKTHPTKITNQFKYILEADELLARKSSDLDHLVKLNALLPLKYVEKKLTLEKKNIAEQFNYDIGIHLLSISNRYFEYLSHIVFLEYIQKASPKTQGVLKDLHELFLVNSLIDNPNYLIQSGYIQPEDIQNMRKRKIELMNIIKDQAIGLVDAFEYTDKDLGTHIGNFDGKPYERMYEWATTFNSINQIQVYEGVQKLKNIKLKSKL